MSVEALGAYPLLLEKANKCGWNTYLHCADKGKPNKRKSWDSAKIWTLELRDGQELIVKVSSKEQGQKAFSQLGLLGAAALARAGRA